MRRCVSKKGLDLALEQGDHEGEGGEGLTSQATSDKELKSETIFGIAVETMSWSRAKRKTASIIEAKSMMNRG